MGGGATGAAGKPGENRTKTPEPEGQKGLNGRLMSRGCARVYTCAHARVRELNYMRAGEVYILVFTNISLYPYTSPINYAVIKKYSNYTQILGDEP